MSPIVALFKYSLGHRIFCRSRPTVFTVFSFTGGEARALVRENRVNSSYVQNHIALKLYALVRQLFCARWNCMLEMLSTRISNLADFSDK